MYNLCVYIYIYIYIYMHACTDMCVCAYKSGLAASSWRLSSSYKRQVFGGGGERHRGTKPSKAYIPTIVQATMELLNSEAVMAQGRADFFGRMMGLGG